MKESNFCNVHFSLLYIYIYPGSQASCNERDTRILLGSHPTYEIPHAEMKSKRPPSPTTDPLPATTTPEEADREDKDADRWKFVLQEMIW